MTSTWCDKINIDLCAICIKVMIQVVTLHNRSLSGVVYSVKSKGPKTEPWRTPQEVGSMSEKQLPIYLACRLSARYELNQLRAVPDIPYHVDKRVVRMSWSVVSKAADRSIRVSAVTLSLSMLRFMSLCTFKRATDVL